MFKNDFELYENISALRKIYKSIEYCEDCERIRALDLIALHTELFIPNGVFISHQITDYIKKTFELPSFSCFPKGLCLNIFSSVKNLPEKYYEFYANFYSWGVRELIAKNSNTPSSVLKMLEDDVDEVVRRNAKNSLQNRGEE